MLKVFCLGMGLKLARFVPLFTTWLKEVWKGHRKRNDAFFSKYNYKT